MLLLSQRFALRVACTALIALALAAPAAAQAIAVVSPHNGEEVRDYRFYWVRWSATAIPGNAGFFVYYFDGAGEQRHICTAPPSGRACEWFEPDWFATTLFVEARDSSGNPLVTVQSAPFQVVSGTLPPAFEHYDVGNVGRSGHAWGDRIAAMTVRGAGGDIWGTADAFHFAYAETYGDMNARATIAGLDGTHEWTKVGLMVRENLTPGAPHHFVLASRNKGLAYQRRLGQGSESLHTSLASVSALPVTVEAMRRAGYVEMYLRRGEGPWARVAHFDMGQAQMLVGLAVTSHDTAVLADGDFTAVHVGDAGDSVRILAPEDGEAMLAGTPYTISWTHRQPVNVATVSYTVDGGTTWTVIPGCQSIASTSCQWNNPGPVTESARLRVVIEDPDDRTAWTVTYPFAIRAEEPGALPSGWSSRDIGSVGATGGGAYDARTGRFTIDGAGADIWGTADAFHYVSRTFSNGPEAWFEVTARVMSVQNSDQWTKVGLMVRSHDGARAPHASFFVTPTTVKGTAFQRRRFEAAASVHTAGPSITTPVWLKLVVVSGHVRAFYRHRTIDPWRFLAEDDVTLTGSTFDIGLAVSSHVHGRLARATFDNVTIRPLLSLAGRDIGAVGRGGSDQSDSVTHRVTGSGTDIWGTADAFRFRGTDVGPDAIVSARVLSIDNTHPWAKAGVMLRENDMPGSKHVMLIVSAGRGLAMQYRGVTNGASANVVLFGGGAPEWVRLVRSGALVIGETSPDGLTWFEAGRISVPMDDDVLGGLAVTSHNNGALATAVFDDVVVR